MEHDRTDTLTTVLRFSIVLLDFLLLKSMMCLRLSLTYFKRSRKRALRTLCIPQGNYGAIAFGKTVINFCLLFSFDFRGVALKILQAAKETLKQEEHSGWWKHIPSRNLFALSTDTSPEIRPLAKWNPQVISLSRSAHSRLLT